MDKPLSAGDFADMEDQLKACVEEDRQYWRVNDVKCDAIHTAKTYEEFADRVAAAHLQPLDQRDFKKKYNRKWNQYATEEKKPSE
ncbi:hypothetical protein HW555_009724 [Spodoptera exigua]|uniref:Dynein attachment factor N-terminal domain-containing protein n=1 Tax=Spodoptera exigua TaxID=7107 RepID=A0A835GAP1_SPOEX|nr:hypothetical protein HW555_009724 [Spodoptera exigua]